EEKMKSVVVGTAGHIDHGKSALVRALTGTDPDRLKEEKARGITIDLGFAHAEIEDVNFAFVDVPGHERFVKNKLAGVGGIDLVVLVVAADESVMPQTREHFDICRLLRVPAGLVALTKADLVDADTLELARIEIRELVAGSFLDGAPMVPLSAKTGAGLDDFRSALLRVSASVQGRAVEAVTRLPIDRVFSMKGFGTVVTGTLVSGRVTVDAELAIAPPAGSRTTVKVRGVQVHGEKRSEATAGNRTAVNLSGVDVEDVSRGQSVVTPGAFEVTRLVDATIQVLPGAKPIKHGARVRFHQGTDEIIGRVTVVGQVGQVGKAQREVPAIPSGGSAFVRLRLERPAVLARGDRYILRAYSPPITIAGGVILDTKPPRTAIRTAAAAARSTALAGSSGSADAGVADLPRAAAVFVADAGDHGLDISALVSRGGADPRRLDVLIDQLTGSGAAFRAGDTLVTPAIAARVRAGIADVLRDHHQKQPLSEGIPREELRERVFARGSVAVFDRVLADLEREGAVTAKDRVALATHRVALSPEETRARDAIERAYRDAALTPPDAASLAAATKLSAPIIDRVTKLLQRQKVLVRVDTLVFHEDALKKLKLDVGALKSAGGGAARIDVATFKERFGVTRKFAIPLLEYLDRERVRRRVGDARVVL
ncbi:MAG TPA: selenocysteine-specific translation elongation factor, partial [Vicinamibacterales bacterium]|nr:selenocysteine-specific translation elongation factor [Vicinamibacterales bacterium]